MLKLLCLGAEIDEKALEVDDTRLLRPIHDHLQTLRDGKHITTNLLSNEEKRFMWNLAFVLARKHPVIARKTYYLARSFITYNGIFMGPGYDRGVSVWRKTSQEIQSLLNDGTLLN